MSVSGHSGAGSESGPSYLHVDVVLNPLTKAAQRVAPILEWLRASFQASIKVLTHSQQWTSHCKVGFAFTAQWCRRGCVLQLIDGFCTLCQTTSSLFVKHNKPCGKHVRPPLDQDQGCSIASAVVCLLVLIFATPPNSHDLHRAVGPWLSYSM